VRRIRSIALVHDMLSRDAGEEVPFVDILRPLVRMVEDGLVSPEQKVEFSVEGDAGIVPAEVATPLAVVLNELLQNAVDHAFGTGGGRVVVQVATESDRIDLAVRDDGRGLPDGFSFESATGLGLSIVRALVVSDLGGSISASSPTGSGTLVSLSVPLHGS
jgi:two-component sensor histidine kinase